MSVVVVVGCVILVDIVGIGIYFVVVVIVGQVVGFVYEFVLLVEFGILFWNFQVEYGYLFWWWDVVCLYVWFLGIVVGFIVFVGYL